MADYEDQTDYADDADVLGDTAVSRDDEGGARPEGLSKQPSINAGSGAGEYSDEAELEEIKKHVREMEEETEKLKEMQSEVEKQLNSSGSAKVGGNTLTIEEKQEVDARSIFVGGVDFGATAEELEAHFHGCGAINRVTILTDRYSGHPKGYAYIEFADKDSVTAAMALDETLFRARQLKVMPKRTNLPGVNAPRGGRGGGFRGGFRGGWGGGGFRGGYGGYGAPYPPAFPPYGGPRGAYRGAGRSRRPRAWYAPY